ncbi:MAG TPA: glycosyltransferase family 1 protein [Flavipsychrobacter sp.]|nr:glycosyltransferase family 1 protein [Flavipsychrobacter sp.]
MRRVIFDCERMKYVNTGLYHYCLNLGRRLQEYIDKGEEQLSFFYPSKIAVAFGENANYVGQNSLRKFYLPNLSGHDIWHCTYQNSQYIPKRNRKIKVVLSIHDLNFLYEGSTEAKKAKYLRHLQKNVDRSDVIVCISEFSKNDVLAHCAIGNKPLHVILNGTNSLEEPALQHHSYKPRRPFLFSIGVMCRKKNFHALLPLVEQNRELELLIAGRPDDSEYTNFIKESARRLKIEDNVQLLYNISETEKAWYYENCYAFMMPSLAEGFGLPVVEAMSVGKPVFLSRRAALPEIGSDKAFYFEGFDREQMQDVFVEGMRQYRDNNMHEYIRAHSQSFSWDKAAKQYIELYRSLK